MNGISKYGLKNSKYSELLHSKNYRLHLKLHRKNKQKQKILQVSKIHPSLRNRASNIDLATRSSV